MYIFIFFLFLSFFLNLISPQNSGSCLIDGHYLQIKCESSESSSDIDPLLTLSGDIPFNLTGPEPCRLEYLDTSGKTIYDVMFSCVGDMDTYIFATLSYGSKTVELSLRNNPPSNTINHTFNCRMRLRITKHGISLMPTLMTDFKCVYRFNFWNMFIIWMWHIF